MVETPAASHGHHSVTVRGPSDAVGEVGVDSSGSGRGRMSEAWASSIEAVKARSFVPV